jgi:hypothetical protein
LFIPAPAFRPEPIILQPFASSVYQAVAQNGGAAAATRMARRCCRRQLRGARNDGKRKVARRSVRIAGRSVSIR